jgi:hypothetical protein
MKHSALVCIMVALTAAPASAQLATTKLYNHVDTPASITYNASGQAQVVLDPAIGSIISVAGYHRVSIRIGTTKATSFMLNMGKISNTTLSRIITRSINQQIHTFDVVGPEMVLVLVGGPPNTTESVRLWVFLST